MKLTDGKRTVEIIIVRWDGFRHGPDWSQDYFNAGSLPYDEETNTYTVPDVQYCIDITRDGGPEEGACWTTNEDGEPVFDFDTEIIVTEL